jgi:hypothetical protein
MRPYSQDLEALNSVTCGIETMGKKLGRAGTVQDVFGVLVVALSTVISNFQKEKDVLHNSLRNFQTEVETGLQRF